MTDQARAHPSGHLAGFSGLLPPLLVAGVAVLTRGLLLAARHRAFLEYRASGAEAVLAYGGSNVPGWLGMARHLAGQLDFSYWLMGARPPLFPLSVALVYKLGGDNLLALGLQALFGVLTVLAGYLLARHLFQSAGGIRHPERAALLAGLVMVVDPASVSASVTLLAEPVFNLTFCACILFLALYIEKQRWHYLALGALAMALAMMARPTAIYLWVAAPFFLIPFVRRWWQPVLVLGVVGLAVYLGWSARNLRYHGVFTYSLQTNFTLLFLRGLSAEHRATGAPVDELYVAYVRELYERTGDHAAATEVDALSFWDFLVAPTPRLYAEMGTLAREKLLAYWPQALLGTAAAVWRMFGITQALPPWFRPVELVYHAGLYGLMLAGVWQAIRQRSWLLLAVTGVPILYVTGLTFVSQVSAMGTRMRTPISAPIIILAAYGLSAGLGAIRARKQPDQKAA